MVITSDGNVTGDAARGMAIGYNLLNLPSWFNDGQSDMMVFYDYLADGTKVALHREDTGMGRAWLGDLVFNMEEQVSEPENLFGGRHDTPSSTTLTSNRYGFSGKERQNLFSTTNPYLDFGARFYDPLTTHWLSPDPLADKYTSLTCSLPRLSYSLYIIASYKSFWRTLSNGASLRMTRLSASSR